MQKVAPGNSEYEQMSSMKTAVFTEKNGRIWNCDCDNIWFIMFFKSSPGNK